jgi:non-ribosomal peptide synthetase component F
MLSVLKSGGTFVPLDPSHPTARLQGLAASVDAKVMLCSREHVPKMSEVCERVVGVDEDFFTSLDTNVLQSSVQMTSSNAAYIIFTSGSTGQPKVRRSVIFSSFFSFLFFSFLIFGMNNGPVNYIIKGSGTCVLPFLYLVSTSLQISKLLSYD